MANNALTYAYSEMRGLIVINKQIIELIEYWTLKPLISEDEIKKLRLELETVFKKMGALDRIQDIEKVKIAKSVKKNPALKKDLKIQNSLEQKTFRIENLFRQIISSLKKADSAYLDSMLLYAYDLVSDELKKVHREIMHITNAEKKK